MKKFKDFEKIALQMIERTYCIWEKDEEIELKKDLLQQLKAADDVCETVDGMLVSRQVIAAIIVNWQQTHLGQLPYNVIEEDS